MATVRLAPQKMRDVFYGGNIDVRENEVFVYQVAQKGSHHTGSLSALDIDVSGREVEALAATKQVYHVSHPKDEDETKYECIAGCEVLLLARKAGAVTVTVTPILADGSLGQGEVCKVRLT